MRHQMHSKVPCDHVYICGYTKWKSTVIQMWRNYNPGKLKVVKCYVDSTFGCGWSQSDVDNAENFMSCTRYIITYAGFPVLWCSKLKTEIALSTT